MPDEIDRINETVEDRAGGRDFGTAAFVETQVPAGVRELLGSTTAKVAAQQAAAHQLALRTGCGVLAKITRPRPFRLSASFELTHQVERGKIEWAPDPISGFPGWPE